MTLSEEEKDLVNIAISELKELNSNYDTEVAHIQADAILTELLTDLGLEEVVDVYETISKWYA